MLRCVAGSRGIRRRGRGVSETLLRYHASHNVMQLFSGTKWSTEYRMVIRVPPIAHPRTLVANQGSRARITEGPAKIETSEHVQMSIHAVWGPSVSHSPSGSTSSGYCPTRDPHYAKANIQRVAHCKRLNTKWRNDFSVGGKTKSWIAPTANEWRTKVYRGLLGIRATTN